MSASPTVLVVTTARATGAALEMQLARLGYRAEVALSTSALFETLNARPPSALLLELALEDATSFPLLERLVQEWPDLGTVVIDSALQPEAVTRAVALGIVDVLTRPLDDGELGRAIATALATASALIGAPPERTVVGDLLGESKGMQQVRELLRRAAPGTATVLIRGESGTGKELAARSLHALGPRKGKPFVKVLCAALPETLLESELFGYERGAFTGATSRKPGRVELADGGTLFLDEIGDITPAIQVKLLRLLQDREFERLGGREVLKVDVRFVAATNRNLDEMVKAREFREDLFYRLNVVTSWLPPLRARRDDIIPLAQHFCAFFGPKNGKPGIALSDAALSALKSQRWPGNVRELQNFIEKLVVLTDGPLITPQNIELELALAVTTFVTQQTNATKDGDPAPPSSLPVVSLSEAVQQAERAALLRALRHAKGNRALAARLLGVARTTLYKKLEEHGLV